MVVRGKEVRGLKAQAEGDDERGRVLKEMGGRGAGEGGVWV